MKKLVKISKQDLEYLWEFSKNDPGYFCEEKPAEYRKHRKIKKSCPNCNKSFDLARLLLEVGGGYWIEKLLVSDECPIWPCEKCNELIWVVQES